MPPPGPRPTAPPTVTLARAAFRAGSVDKREAVLPHAFDHLVRQTHTLRCVQRNACASDPLPCGRHQCGDPLHRARELPRRATAQTGEPAGSAISNHGTTSTAALSAKRATPSAAKRSAGGGAGGGGATSQARAAGRKSPKGPALEAGVFPLSEAWNAELGKPRPAARLRRAKIRHEPRSGCPYPTTPKTGARPLPAPPPAERFATPHRPSATDQATSSR
jgi:hypothetical protein